MESLRFGAFDTTTFPISYMISTDRRLVEDSEELIGFSSLYEWCLYCKRNVISYQAEVGLKTRLFNQETT